MLWHIVTNIMFGLAINVAISKIASSFEITDTCEDEVLKKASANQSLI